MTDNKSAYINIYMYKSDIFLDINTRNKFNNEIKIITIIKDSFLPNLSNIGAIIIPPIAKPVKIK